MQKGKRVYKWCQIKICFSGKMCNCSNQISFIFTNTTNKFFRYDKENLRKFIYYYYWKCILTKNIRVRTYYALAWNTCHYRTYISISIKISEVNQKLTQVMYNNYNNFSFCPQVNFLVCQILALFLASIFRSYLHHSKVSTGVRHAFGLGLGLVFGYICFGLQAIHIAGLPAACYIIIRTQNPEIVQR